MAPINSSFVTGFVRRSSAPALMTFTVVGMSACPVKKTMGRCDPRADKRSCNSGPLKPGILMSRRTQLGPASSGSRCSNCSADAYVSRGAQETPGCGAEGVIVINDVHDG